MMQSEVPKNFRPMFMSFMLADFGMTRKWTNLNLNTVGFRFPRLEFMIYPSTATFKGKIKRVRRLIIGVLTMAFSPCTYAISKGYFINDCFISV